MADMNTGNMSPEEYAQQQALTRQQQMATLLMQQGMQNQPQGQMVSGRYVPTSFFQNLVPLANIAASKYVGEKADTEQAKLAAAIRQNRAAAEESILNKVTGAPAQATEMAGPYTGNVPMPIAVQPAVAPDYAGALREISTNQYGAGKDLKPTILKQMMPEETADYKNFLKVKSEGFPGTFNDYQTLDANRKRPVTSLSVNMPTEGERKAGFMANILDNNIKQMQTALGVDPTAVKPNVPASVVEAIAGPNLLSRSLKPAQRQIIEDSQLDVLDAALTLRTGAAYTKEQLVGMRDTYFPRLGDTPDAVNAKKQRLETLLGGAYIASGRATPPRVSDPYVPPTPKDIGEADVATCSAIMACACCGEVPSGTSNLAIRPSGISNLAIGIILLLKS